MSRASPPLPPPSEGRQDKRRAVVERMAAAHLATMQGTLAETVGESNRQRLVWLSLLATPLLFPVALPGMASAVGGFCLLTAYGICMGRSAPLPAWLAKRELDGRIKALLTAMVSRVIHVISWVGRPRILSLTHPSARLFKALMLSGRLSGQPRGSGFGRPAVVGRNPYRRRTAFARGLCCQSVIVFIMKEKCASGHSPRNVH